MPLTSAERVSLIVRCDSCGEGIEKLLAWLVSVNDMTCPHCSGAINLKTGDNRLRIQKLAEACAGIDASLSKSSENL